MDFCWNPADRQKYRLYESQLSCSMTQQLCGEGSLRSAQTKAARGHGQLITLQTLPCQRSDMTQWGTAAPHHTFPCCFSLFSHREHRIRTECDTYGQGWRRSLVCDLCSTPARCRRPPWACQAGGGTSWWWCRRGEDQEGGCLWKRKKKHKTAR